MHVQCTCKYFVPVVLLSPLQARRYAPLIFKLAGHMYASYRSLYVFVVTVRVGCRLRAPGPEKFFLGGVLRF